MCETFTPPLGRNHNRGKRGPVPRPSAGLLPPTPIHSGPCSTKPQKAAPQTNTPNSTTATRTSRPGTRNLRRQSAGRISMSRCYNRKPPHKRGPFFYLPVKRSRLPRMNMDESSDLAILREYRKNFWRHARFTVLQCPQAVRVVLAWRSHLSFTRGLNHDE